MLPNELHTKTVLINFGKHSANANNTYANINLQVGQVQAIFGACPKAG